MDISKKQDGDKVTLALSGRFDFSAHRNFRNYYQDALELVNIKSIVLDMAGVDYLDSSALGMLLLLNEHARASNVEISITHCSAGVMKILNIANFSKIIKIA
jgi:anti-anti-sigma factor